MKKAIKLGKRMRTVSFEIEDEDFQALQAIAARFFEGCFKGSRPMDIRELAHHAILGKKRDMAWVLEPTEKHIPPGRVIPGPWKPL